MPFLTALPIGTQVNVNTAPPEVLAAIVENVEPKRSASLIASRKAKPFTTIADFRSRLPEGATVAGTESLNVTQLVFLRQRRSAAGRDLRAGAGAGAAHQRRARGRWSLWQVVE